jgi:hypothetical protein
MDQSLQGCGVAAHNIWEVLAKKPAALCSNIIRWIRWMSVFFTAGELSFSLLLTSQETMFLPMFDPYQIAISPFLQVKSLKISRLFPHVSFVNNHKDVA